MPPIHLLGYMAPLALLQLAVMAIAFGEVTALMDKWEDLEGSTALYVVGITGLSSFSLNLLSFQANKVTSPLTLSIMANVKQVCIHIYVCKYAFLTVLEPDSNLIFYLECKKQIEFYPALTYYISRVDPDPGVMCI